MHELADGEEGAGSVGDGIEPEALSKGAVGSVVSEAEECSRE